VQSAEGEVRADAGDWIVRSNGHAYPLSDSLFRSRFEMVGS
jgi:hypothetical protein